MKKFNLLLFFAVLFAGFGFSQTTSYIFSNFADSTVGCMNGLYVGMSTGINGESAGVLTVDWGDGNIQTINYTAVSGQNVGYDLTHGYAVAGTYTVNMNVYSGTAGANVDAGQSTVLTAADPANCGYIYIMTSQSSSSVSYTYVPMDFTGQDGITTTIIPAGGPAFGDTYSGLNLANAPYTVSINDTWLANNGLVQVSPDFTITSFQPSGIATNSQASMEVSCAVAATDPDFAVSWSYAFGFVAPLQTGEVAVDVCNFACSNTDDAHVSLDFPAGFVPNTAGLSNATVTGNTLTFDFLGLSDCISQTIDFTFPGTVTAGTVINFNVNVTNADDSNPSNNSDTISTIVMNSYDPNSKDVNKPTHIDPNTQEELQYVIHFQNEGNFAAMDVVVSDTIDANLDLSSFQVLGAKHGVATSVNPATRVVTFSFNDINLAPASQDEEGSQGFVVYSIKENAGLPVGSEIRNTAYIYFDFNPAIITNTTYNINEALGLNEQTMEAISMFPNPASTSIRFNGAQVESVQIFDMAGKQLISVASLDNNELSVASLANGMYQVVIVTSKGMQAQKLVIRK